MSLKQIGLIVTAYTGIGCCNFSDFHKFAEELLERPIYTHEFANEEVWETIKERVKPQFLALAERCANEKSTITS